MASKKGSVGERRGRFPEEMNFCALFQTPTDHQMGKTQSKSSGDDVTNTALVFVKPHAMNMAVISFVRIHLKNSGCKILSENTVQRDRIDNDGIIDAHYFSISKYAYEIEPKDLTIRSDKKEEFFVSSFARVTA